MPYRDPFFEPASTPWRYAAWFVLWVVGSLLSGVGSGVIEDCRHQPEPQPVTVHLHSDDCDCRCRGLR